MRSKIIVETPKELARIKKVAPCYSAISSSFSILKKTQLKKVCLHFFDNEAIKARYPTEKYFFFKNGL